MIKNYLVTAVRNIRKNKGYFSLNIAGLVIGMVCFILLMLGVVYMLNCDRFHDNLDRLAVVSLRNDLATGGRTMSATQAPMAPLLKESVPGIEDYVRMVNRPHTLSINERSFSESILFADSSILTVLSFAMLKGDPFSALRSPHAVVLTESAAARYFGNEDPMGKTVVLNSNISLEVTGVLREIPANSSIRFEVLAPFDLLNEVGEDVTVWAGLDYFTLLLASPGMAGPELYERIGSFCQDFYGERQGSESSFTTYFASPFSELVLYGADGRSAGKHAVLVVSVIALCLLIVSGMNFVMLTTARAGHRGREAGVRKVLGASNGQIVRQILVETTLVSVLAMLISLAIVQVVVHSLSAMVHVDLRMESFALELGGILLLCVVVIGLAAGVFPAISIAATRPVGGIRGKLVTGSSGRRFRRILVVAQFAVAVVFLMLAALLHQQLRFISAMDLGLDKQNVIRLPATVDLEGSYGFFKQRLLESPSIVAVTTAGQNIVHINSSSNGGWDFDGCDPNTKIELHFDWVGYDYDRVFGLQMAEGRFYSEEIASDARDAFVLNEEAVRLMGIDDPVGKRFSYLGRDGTIIGVVRNFHLEPLDETLKPLILILEPVINYVYVKTAPGDPGEALATVEAAFHEVSPRGTFVYSFLEDTFLRAQGKFLSLLAVFGWAAVLIAFVAGLGLFALISFMAERRRKEIGIRKTFGAKTLDIAKLLSREFVMLAAVSLVLGCPLAYFLGEALLSEWPYRTQIGWSLFAVTGLLAATVVSLSIGLQVFRAARANPVDVIQYE